MKTFNEIKKTRTKELFGILNAFDISKDRQQIIWSLLFASMSDCYARGRLDKEAEAVSCDCECHDGSIDCEAKCNLCFNQI